MAIPDDEYWEQQATTARREQLKNVRAVATSWQASIAAILGVFGTVAFVKGPSQFGDVQTLPQGLLIATILIAAVLAGVALVCAALAAQGGFHKYDVLTGVALEKSQAESAGRAVRMLAFSRWLAIAAAVLVAVGSAVAWLATVTTEATAAETVVVIYSDGVVRCGELRTGSATGSAKLKIGDELIDLTDVTSIKPVSACP